MCVMQVHVIVYTCIIRFLIIISTQLKDILDVFVFLYM